MVAFRRRRFADLPEWAAADHGLAHAAFRRSAEQLVSGAFRTGTLGIAAAAFRDAAASALATERDDAVARAFFEEYFVPLQIVPDAAATDGEHGFVTGYYEPVVEASAIKTPRFRFPLYVPPPELVKIDDVSRPPGMDPSFRFARRKSCGLLEEHPDRAAIEAGLLRGRGLEIAWLADPVDAFFIHIQGSARLELTDGRQMRVGFAAKSGHEFTAIGRLLVDAGELTLAEADMDGIRAWLAAHPERQRALFDRNRSFIFFREAAVDDASLGPVGAAQVPLTALASIAVDRELATFGVPYFIAASQLRIGGRPFNRLMIAQDTGSAIIGPARADIYVGSGFEAGRVAGRIRDAADFTVLVPPRLAESLAR
ncbi:transglycosylase [Aurantimonas aggregata]|uniref:peptidoglycan lytic exotransglycosylase n=1 Tax=Aurantimonas aggregata TaxID=2047720 RepID=A0A6L9MKM7_9HYPH|nr:MltA domain-containing protein [Aurantimonas aggregata]NDV88397.1 transglycosylase [Aurantimonas aggregata]